MESIIKINNNNIDNSSTNDFIKRRKKIFKISIKKTILNMNIYFMFDFTKKHRSKFKVNLLNH